MTWQLWPKGHNGEQNLPSTSLQDCNQSLKRLEESVCDLDKAVQKLRQAVFSKKNGNHN